MITALLEKPRPQMEALSRMEPYPAVEALGFSPAKMQGPESGFSRGWPGKASLRPTGWWRG